MKKIFIFLIVMGNVSNLNHFIHFVLGIISIRYNLIVPIFLIYQIIDGSKFNYIVTLTGLKTDDIYLDLLFFSLGGVINRLF